MFNRQILTGAFYVGNEWMVAGGCWDDYETSDDWGSFPKIPAFSTSKNTLHCRNIAMLDYQNI